MTHVFSVGENLKCRVTKTNGIEENIDTDFSEVLGSIVTNIVENISDGCWVRLSNGKIVHLLADPNDGNTIIDSDNDGKADLSELKCKVRFKLDWIPENIENNYNIGEYVEYWEFYSNPASDDTDGDGIKDGEDIFPCEYQPMEFGLDAYSVFLLKLLYKNFYKDSTIDSNYEFCRCIASVSYGNTVINLSLWNTVAGLYDNFFVKGVMQYRGLSENQSIVLFTDIYDEHNNAFVENNVDFSHMMATMSCSLYSGKSKSLGAFGAVTPALHGTVEDYAGYYGDVFGTLFVPPNLGNDDYMSDLDAVILLDKIKHNTDLFDAMEKYYCDI